MDEKIRLFACNKESEMNECDHLFVKLKEGISYCGFHSSDCGNDPITVICLKCGLTNRFILMDDIDRECDMILRYKNPYYKAYQEVNDRVFRKQFNHAYRRGGKSFDDSVFNLISKSVFKSNHPILLYNIAKSMNPSMHDTELFEIMKKLHEIETPKERLGLRSENEIKEVIERYNLNNERTKRLELLIK